MNLSGDQCVQMESNARPRPYRPHFPSPSSTCYGIGAPLVLCLAFFWPFGGGTKVQMMSGTETPAAHGKITIKNGPNGNLDLGIKVEALAKPSSLTPAENVYVVWLQRPGELPHDMGELQVNDKLDGKLQSETPDRRFKIFITAEQNAQEQAPQGPQVLSADVAGS